MNVLSRIIFVAILLVTISSCTCKYYIVRHADRFPNGQLTQDGVDRANDLWAELSDKNIDEIYTTGAQRTIDTANPTADATGLTAIVIDGQNTPQLVSRLRQTSKKNILVVGHSNTVPVIVDSLMKASQSIVIPHDDYDNLFIIRVRRGNTISRNLLRTTYGKTSPKL